METDIISLVWTVDSNLFLFLSYPYIQVIMKVYHFYPDSDVT